jgi:hypothetical protein
MSDTVQNIGRLFAAEFETARNARRNHEQRWLDDLRDYRGQYDEATLARLEKSGGSRLYIRLTKQKVKTVLARLMDLLFPANGEKNWGIQPTPDPELPPEQVAMFAQQFIAQTGQPPGPMETQQYVRETVTKAAEAMGKTIEDQLAETPQKTGYRQEIKKVIKSGLVYGTGILKGPLVTRARRQAWVPDPATGQFRLQEVKGDLQPYFEFVPIWDVYPEPEATEVRNCRYIWHDHLQTKAEVLDVCVQEQMFDEDLVREYLRDHPDGDATMENHEQSLRSIGADEAPRTLDRRYRLHERWGMVSARDLVKAGMDLPDENVDEYFANIWLLGDKCVKCVLNPIEGVRSYFYFWNYDRDETSIWGEGIPADMRDPAKGFNASIRKMVDSYSISGPMFGVNAAAMDPTEDPRDIHANKAFLFESAEDIQKALQIWTIPAFIQDGVAMTGFFQNFVDEVTAPRFMQGDNPTKGAGGTASGLSMLMGAVNVNLKDLVKDFDDFITAPFIEALYHWNMNFNPQPETAGDFEVVARGSTALMAREIRAQQLMQAAQVTDSPRFQGWSRDDKLLRELFKAMDVAATDLIKTKEEHQAEQQQQMAQQAGMIAKQQVTETMNEMRARGLQPEQALVQMLGQSAQEFLQAQQAQRV